MTGGKKSSKEKKKRRRRRSVSYEGGTQGEKKRKSSEHNQQEAESPCLPAGDENEAEELSDIEEGGLDLNVPLKPISYYVTDKKEMLQQCFRVVGEKKLQKMLPDLLKSYSIEEIKQLCQEQLELISEKRLLNILEGEHGIDSATEEESEGHEAKSAADLSIHHDNTVDSTSSLKDNAGLEDAELKAGRGEDCDAISINADTFDSDIEEACPEERGQTVPAMAVPKAAGQQDDLVMDIEKSVNEILGMAEPAAEEIQAPSNMLAEDVQPSAQQLELLELEMRARAIKALMKAGDVKKS